jgi:serine/threonine protein phosphatase PrpC
MGAFLDKPITEKETQTTTGNGLSAASTHMQGWRVSMEDASIQNHTVGSHSDISLFGVFDGHGGSYAAQYVQAKLAGTITSLPLWSDGAMDADLFSDILREAGLQVDAQLRSEAQVRSGEDHSGTTAVFGFVTPTHVIIANIGDSRAVMGVGGKTVEMSHDHKPTNATEEARIQAAGGSVTMGRVNGDLAVSRALGDFSYKQSSHLDATEQQVSPEADIIVVPRTSDDEFLILACDGIWDVFSNEQCTQYFRETLEGGTSAEQACESLLDECLKRKSRDNMTVILVQFDK